MYQFLSHVKIRTFTAPRIAFPQAGAAAPDIQRGRRIEEIEPDSGQLGSQRPQKGSMGLVPVNRDLPQSLATIARSISSVAQ
jgi:hypothetical protein